uniref:Uncharacterized protein n=1 Tax=Peronospora matthiolae TaxID=2874970 RepID=A0AAV1UAZ1_9STRA
MASSKLHTLDTRHLKLALVQLFEGRFQLAEQVVTAIDGSDGGACHLGG